MNVRRKPFFESNSLILGHNNMTKLESDVYDLLLSKVPQTEDVSDIKPFVLDAKDFTGLFECPSNHIYKMMNGLSGNFAQCYYRYRDDEGGIHSTPLFKDVIYRPKENKNSITFIWNDTIKPLLVNLKEQGYTQFDLLNTFKLSSYTKKLYKILKSKLGNKHSYNYFVSLKDLRTILGLYVEDKYGKVLKDTHPGYGKFREKVVEVLKEKLDKNIETFGIFFSYKPYKREGKKVLSIIFNIHKFEKINIEDSVFNQKPIFADNDEIPTKFILLLPEAYQEIASVIQLLAPYVSKGVMYVKSNIDYTLKHQDSQKGTFSGYLKKSLENDYAKKEREQKRAENLKKWNLQLDKMSKDYKALSLKEEILNIFKNKVSDEDYQMLETIEIFNYSEKKIIFFVKSIEIQKYFTSTFLKVIKECLERDIKICSFKRFKLNL